jgi:hypothetical protein
LIVPLPLTTYKKVHYSERWIRQRCIDGKIPGAYKLTDGRKWLIPTSEAKRFGKRKVKRHSEAVEKAPHVKGDHFALMTDIAHYLSPEWAEIRPSELEPPEDLTKAQMLSWFLKRIEQACMKFGDKKVDCLISHLTAYLPVLASKSFYKLLEEEPHKVYETLWLIGQRGIAGGTCVVCKS